MTMTQVQIEEFLRAPRHAIVGTNRADGPPHLSPVWYLYDEGRIFITADVTTIKYRNLRQDPRVAVCIDAGYPDYRTVTLYGTATLMEADDTLVQEIRWRIIRRYHEKEDAARRYFESTRHPDNGLIVVTPQKILSQDFN